MKFLVSKDLHSNKNFTLLISFYSFMMLVYFISDLLYLSHFFGSSTQAVLYTLKGNAEEFIEPLSLVSLLEHLHISLFLGLLALFTTMAIALRLNLSNRHKEGIILLSMGGLLISIISLLATYFLWDAMVYLLIASTLLWHLSGAYALILAFFQIGMKKT